MWLVNHMIDTGFINTIREIWWDVRPHHNFGTVEVRMCDMPGNSTTRWRSPRSSQCLVKALSDEIDHGTYQHDSHPMMVSRTNGGRPASARRRRLVDTYTFEVAVGGAKSSSGWSSDCVPRPTSSAASSISSGAAKWRRRRRGPIGSLQLARETARQTRRRMVRQLVAARVARHAAALDRRRQRRSAEVIRLVPGLPLDIAAQARPLLLRRLACPRARHRAPPAGPCRSPECRCRAGCRPVGRDRPACDS